MHRNALNIGLITGLSLIMGLVIYLRYHGQIVRVVRALLSNPSSDTLPPMQVSGWVAYWKEEEAYSTINTCHKKLTNISPVWFQIDKDFQLIEVGKENKKQLISKLQNYGLTIYPSLTSNLTATEISPLFNDQEQTEIFTDTLLARLADLKVDGLDVDLELITVSDKDAFTTFVQTLSRKLHDHNLKLSLTLYAKTGKNDWAGTLSQDTEKLAKLADEVRIMAYDEHGTATGPGAITPTSWLKEVVTYNLRVVGKEKLVIGLPAYGYIWKQNAKANGMQFDDFTEYVKDTGAKISRDKDSGELIFTADSYVGWLSDSSAIQHKINTVRSLGLYRVALWNLGGMDETFFTAQSRE